MGVSCRGFDNWVNRPLLNWVKEDQLLVEAISWIYFQNREVYSAPHIHKTLLNQKYKCGLHRVARLMRKANIAPQKIIKFRIPTDSRKCLKPAKNHLARQFSPSTKNRVWAADVTYIPTRESWLVLAGILDLFLRRVIGWPMDKHLNSKLAQQALINALQQRDIKKRILTHSDRGKEYYAKDYQELL